MKRRVHPQLSPNWAPAFAGEQKGRWPRYGRKHRCFRGPVDPGTSPGWRHGGGGGTAMAVCL